MGGKMTGRRAGIGFIDASGSPVLSTYQAATPFSGGLAWVQLEELWGAIDTSGALVIEPRFEQVARFSDGLAPARSPGSNKSGYVDTSGAWIIEPRYDYALPFVDGYAPVNTGGEIPAWARAFATLPSGGRWGAVDRSGVEVVGLAHGYAQSADGWVLINHGGRHTGFGAVEGGSWEFFAPRSGERLGRFAEAVVFGDGLAIVRPRGGERVVIDTSGTEVGRLERDGVPGPFASGRAPLSCDGSSWDRSRYVYVDRGGRVVIDNLGEAKPFHQGVAAVNVGGEKNRGAVVGGTWGYCDVDGALLASGPWTDAGRFDCNRGLVWLERGVGFVDRAGALVAGPFDHAWPFSEGFAVVRW